MTLWNVNAWTVFHFNDYNTSSAFFQLLETEIFQLHLFTFAPAKLPSLNFSKVNLLCQKGKDQKDWSNAKVGVANKGWFIESSYIKKLNMFIFDTLFFPFLHDYFLKQPSKQTFWTFVQTFTRWPQNFYEK